jgi:hypothetical protein
MKAISSQLYVAAEPFLNRKSFWEKLAEFVYRPALSKYTPVSDHKSVMENENINNCNWQQTNYTFK